MIDFDWIQSVVKVVINYTQEPSNEQARKDAVRLLLEAGISPKQASKITNHPICNCNYLSRNVDRKMEKWPKKALPSSLPVRLIASTFCIEYLKRCEDPKEFDLESFIYAWLATYERTIEFEFDKLKGFKLEFLSLGPLYEFCKRLNRLARSCELEGETLEQLGKTDGSSSFILMKCPSCGNYFAGFVKRRYMGSMNCCHCDYQEYRSKVIQSEFQQRQEQS